ncbi:MAG: RNA polymerase sigma factor RpoD/SigA [Calditrichaceae bacterium]
MAELYRTKQRNHSLGIYLNEIRCISLISTEEEINLAQRIRNGDCAALSQLVKANLRFVVSIAKTYRNRGLSLNDLINEGNLGLIRAAMRFDETKGCKFISYAVWWIRQGILQAIQENSRMIRLPQNKIGTLNKLSKAKNALEQELEREPTEKEIAGEMQIDQKDLARFTEYNKQVLYLEDSVSHKDSSQVLDLIEDPECDETDHNILKESLQDEINEALNALSEKEADSIKLYFGITKVRRMTLDEIAQQYGLTKERVRQIKERGLTKLRFKTHSKNLKVYLHQ